jgi:hypothetical protein
MKIKNPSIKSFDKKTIKERKEEPNDLEKYSSFMELYKSRHKMSFHQFKEIIRK